MKQLYRSLNSMEGMPYLTRLGTWIMLKTGFLEAEIVKETDPHEMV